MAKHSLYGTRKRRTAMIIRAVAELTVVHKNELLNYARLLRQLDQAFQDIAYSPFVEAERVKNGDLDSFCQLDHSKSCGGCCEDFNQNRNNLKSKFVTRKLAYDIMVKGKRDLPVYKKHMKEIEENDNACPFLAFIDTKQTRIGCLLHPGRPENHGEDLRNFGKYGKYLCKAYKCSSSKKLENATPRKRLFFWQVVHSCSDWYDYSRLFSPSVSHQYHRGLLEIYFHYINEI